MPELPEVEILLRHLRPLVLGQRIRGVKVWRAKVLVPTPRRKFQAVLHGAKVVRLSRRGKYLLFDLEIKRSSKLVTVLGHLGMTGRMFLSRKDAALPKHTAVVLELDQGKFVYEDTRYFGRLTLDVSAVEKLGPEPLSREFDEKRLAESLKRSKQPIKVKLLDQTLVAGIGNIYASEALFRARIPPQLPAARLKPVQIRRLRCAIREVLMEAITCGSTVPINFDGAGRKNGFFYYGRPHDSPDYYEERLCVYDRAGKPCLRCRVPIVRVIQAARSTFFCPKCQRDG